MTSPVETIPARELACRSSEKDPPSAGDAARKQAEEIFHDAWAAGVDVAQIDVRRMNEACTAPEMRHIVRRLGDLHGRTLLDVGCGLGEASVYFALAGADVTAVDISPGMCSAAERLAAANGVSVRTHIAAAEDLGLPNDGTFDVIYIGNALHHVDIAAAMPRLLRHLKPDGVFVSWDPVAYNPVINVYRRRAVETRTSDEHPLTLADIKRIRGHFRSTEVRWFWLCTLLIFVVMAVIQRRDPNRERYWKMVIEEADQWAWLYRPLEFCDRLLLRIPWLRPLCWNVVIVGRNPHALCGDRHRDQPRQRANSAESNRSSTTSRHPAPAFFLGCIIVVLLGLGTMIGLSPEIPVFDEEAHLRAACLLVGYDRDSKGSEMGEKIGLREMLVADIPSAPGPLYPVLHAALFPLTRLEVPRVRYLNFGLFLLACGALAFGLRCWRADASWQLPAMMLAIPATWATVGLAYTEIPAFAMVAFGLAAIAWATSQPEDKVGRSYLGFGVAGLFCGLAIAGRQTYLPAIAAFVAIGIFGRRWRWPAWLGFAVAVLVPLPMFIAWGGLTRRELQTTMGGGVAFTHGVVAFAWLAATLGWLAPRFFSAAGRWVLGAIAGGAVANLLFIHLAWRGYDGILGYLPDWLGRAHEPLMGSVLVAACTAFGAAAAINWWRRRDDGLFALALGLTILLTATATGIVHLYTPRYLMVGFPFVLLVAQPFFMPSKWAVLRLIGGGMLGAISLGIYYSSAYA